jgi:hypothetical protein
MVKFFRQMITGTLGNKDPYLTWQMVTQSESAQNKLKSIGFLLVFRSYLNIIVVNANLQFFSNLITSIYGSGGKFVFVRHKTKGMVGEWYIYLSSQV